MADRVQYLEYWVYLDDKELAENYQAAYPNGVNIAPQTLSAQLALPIIQWTEPYTAPCIVTPYVTGSSKYPDTVAEFSHCRGGWFGLCSLFGRTTTFKWIAKYRYAAGTTPEINGVPVATPEAIRQLFWATSFHLNTNGLSPSWGGGNAAPFTRFASRHVDGMGFAAHGLDDVGEHTQMFFNQMPGGVNQSHIWERFYMRNVRRSSVSVPFWQNNTGGTSCATLSILPAGNLVLNSTDGAGALTVLASSATALNLNEFYKIDVITQFGVGSGRCRVWINGVLEMDQTVGAIGFGASATTTGSRLGYNNLTAFGTCAIDFCDWTCSTPPTTFDSLDWLNGTRIVRIDPTGFASGNTWAGDYRNLLRPIMAHSAAPAAGNCLSNAVASSTLRVTTDSLSKIKNTEGQVGCIGFVGHIKGETVAGTSVMAYKLGSASAVTNNVIEAGGAQFATRYTTYFPSGLTAPLTALEAIELWYTRSASASNIRTWSFFAEAVLVGTFGQCDVTDEAVADVTAIPESRLGKHNAPYPKTIWAGTGIPPTAPVIIVAGTYTGNGTAQELTFRAPVNMLIVRCTTASRLGQFWTTTMHSAHRTQGDGQDAEQACLVAQDESFVPVGGDNDPEERYRVVIQGLVSEVNEAAQVYQYIAIIDPGARFMLNSALSQQNSAAGVTEALKIPTFLPEGVHIMGEQIADAPGNTTGSYFKGPGNAAGSASRLNGGGEIASILTIATGSLTTGATLHSAVEGALQHFSSWRTNDGSGDPNVHKVVKIGSYTGNGGASRTVSFAPSSGLRPLYALVVPSSAVVAIRRDPSHTGTTSTDTAGTVNAATGIISGGIDEFTVGLGLNANGVVYNYFVLMGSATAGNNGWSVNGEFAYVEPDYGYGDDGALAPLPDDDTPVDPDPDPGPDDTDDCADGEVCVAATTRIINLALLEIGVLKVLTNYCTQDTKEAVLARQVYEQCVRHTLIAYPWPFATKYETLALAATQPSNEDWTYSYRMPSDCIFPRRLAVNRGTAIDPNAPPIGLSSDSSGGLIFANEANAVLEYTARPSCVGYNGDDLFIEALKWRVAAALAPALTRIAGEADRCLKMFEIICQKAEATIKVGQPGLRAAASSADVTAAAISANIQVVNRALVRIGAKTIANLSTEQSREAVAANLVFEDELRSTLRDYPWAWATRYQDPMTLVDGSEDDPVNPDWTWSHRLPTDAVFVRRLVKEGTGRKFDPDPSPYRIGVDATGGLLFSDIEEPVIEYTARLENALAFADPIFRDALSWRLAATLAPSLATVDPTRPEQHGRGPETPQDPSDRNRQRFSERQRRLNIAEWAWGMYRKALVQAQVADHNEQEPEPHGDAEWIRARQ